MKTRILFTTLFAILFSIIETSAQVGIGTTLPESTLDIIANNPSGSSTDVDGILVPRITRQRAQSMLSIPLSTLVYIYEITTGTTTGTTVNVTSIGFYFFNGTTWEKINSGQSNYWKINGNNDILDDINYIGTDATNNVDIAFKRNNIPAGKIAINSTSFGVGALTAGTTTNSTAFGNNALFLNTSDNNVAVGNGSLAANTTGTDNVALGNSSLAANISGNQNTGIGISALRLNQGNANTALGLDALRANTTGNNNTGVGFQALASNTTASNNTGVGFQSLRSNITGTSNTAVGFQAGESTTGSSNTSLGFQAHQNNTNGSQNVAIGERSLGRNSGSANTVVGWEAMFGAISNASNATAVGWHALFSNRGANNTAVGWNALQGNTSAADNTAVGARALNDNSIGTRNTAVGKDAAFAATNSDGTFIGFNSGAFSTGSQNTAVGAYTLDASGASTRNVAIGYNALTNATGTNNTAIGHSALNNLVNGSGNVALGYQAGLSETSSNKLYISNSNTSPTSSLIYGEFSPTRILRTNSIFQIGDPTGTGYQFPATRGIDSQLLQTDVNGVLSWVDPSSLIITEVDPEVSSSTINAIPKWDGTTLVDGIITDDGSSVIISGGTVTTDFQMTNGANAGYLLQSDASGNASWVPNPMTNLSTMRINLNANQALTTLGWQKIQFNTPVFDTKSEFAGGTFTAISTGIYQVNAGFHTSDQSNSQFYSIGVYVNGSLYQQTTGNHFGNGPVSRNISCLVNLAAGGTVEIYVENYQPAVDIDSFIGKTFFEVTQIR